ACSSDSDAIDINFRTKHALVPLSSLAIPNTMKSADQADMGSAQLGSFIRCSHEVYPNSIPPVPRLVGCPAYIQAITLELQNQETSSADVSAIEHIGHAKQVLHFEDTGSIRIA